LKLKAQLIRKIRDIVKRRRLTQTGAATLLGPKPRTAHSNWTF
jgi:predicted XRE-type DNA-binding protein